MRKLFPLTLVIIAALLAACSIFDTSPPKSPDPVLPEISPAMAARQLALITQTMTGNEATCVLPGRPVSHPIKLAITPEEAPFGVPPYLAPVHTILAYYGKTVSMTTLAEWDKELDTDADALFHAARLLVRGGINGGLDDPLSAELLAGEVAEGRPVLLFFNHSPNFLGGSLAVVTGVFVLPGATYDEAAFTVIDVDGQVRVRTYRDLLAAQPYGEWRFTAFRLTPRDRCPK